MLPKFPEFKKLELSDKKEIEKITYQYQPYSDFNFECMWSWNLKQGDKVAISNGNLILFTRDIVTQEMVCSYLGSNNLIKTLDELFEYLDGLDIVNPRIARVPEISLKGLDFSKYFIEIDLNSCDYIYDLRKLSELSGNQFMQKRGRVNSFMRNYADAEVKVLKLSDAKVRAELIELHQAWVINKTQHSLEEFSDLELDSLKKFLEANFESAICIGVFDNELIAYAIFTPHRNDYVLNHFIKADISYKGIFEFLIKQSSAVLLDRGFKYMNYQEDMGLMGLRQAKNTYRPVGFLRKYFIGRL